MSETKCNKTSAKVKVPFSHYLTEIFAEPVLLTLTVVLLYDHFKTIWELYPTTAFWNRLFGVTTLGDAIVLTLFIVALIVWALVVIRRLRREAQRDKELSESLAETADRIIQSIDRLTEEIRGNKGNRQKEETRDN